MKKLIVLSGLLFLISNSYSQTGPCIGSSSITITPAPDPATGCYFPGNTVTVCVTINDYAQNGVDWLCGVVPLIGPGWDTTTLAPVSAPASCDGQGYWAWYPTCTSTNSGITYTAGFFYDSPAGATTGMLDSIPGNNFGDNCQVYTWVFCYQITASLTGAAGATGQLGVNEYGDDLAGSWGQSGCVDPPITLNYCIANCTVTVPTVVTTDITTCFGDSTGAAIVTATGGFPPYNYLWSNGATTQSVSGLIGGIYSVIVTDSSGCQKTVYLQIQQPQDINLSASVVGIGCGIITTGSISASVNGGIAPYGYLWNTGATTNSISGLAIGTYTLTVTDSSGCTKTDSWTITTVPSLNVSFTSTDETCGSANGTATITVSGTPPYNYAWTPPVSTGPNATGLSQGAYIVQVSDSNGCSVTDTINIASIATYTYTTTSITANCAGTGGSGIVSVTGSSGPYTFQWSPSGGTDSIAANLNAGTYTVLITDVNNCSQTATIVIGQLTSTVTVTAPVSQSPCDVTTLATITANPANGSAPYSYQWSNSATTATVTGLTAGTYTVIVTDANQCTATMNATIQPFVPITFTTTADTSCSSSSTGSASVTAASGGTPPYSYQWSNGLAGSSINAVASGNYTVTIIDANSCTAMAVVTVNQYPAIVVSVTPDVSSGAPPLTVNFINNNTGGITYSWNFGDGSTASTHDASHVYSSDGTYNGYLVVTNADGCSDTGKFTITVQTSSLLLVYNVMTPNGDLNNDSWKILTHGIISLNTEVYNRWGEKIFEKDFTNGLADDVMEVWDGITKNGKLATDGTYFYIIKAHASDKDYDQSGTITLIRDNKK